MNWIDDRTVPQRRESDEGADPLESNCQPWGAFLR
jgi:hypothetical protein